MRKVLVLEDESSIRGFIVINLRRAGYEVIEAETGEEALEKLKVLLPQVDSMDDVPAMAMAYHDQIVPAMAALRKPVDELELLVDKAIWPVPTYGDLMFEV